MEMKTNIFLLKENKKRENEEYRFNAEFLILLFACIKVE